ncbi:MAG: endonuclease/exonuclease/phosphatase family protein, partial [Pseudomonadota bacterium]|nr:endonuclease/exonuclease/phosphatase family protein [Pseudomonadota bacterium]
MRVISWNINSVRLRAPLVEKLITEAKPDVICLQETKCPNDSFPEKLFHKL